MASDRQMADDVRARRQQGEDQGEGHGRGGPGRVRVVEQDAGSAVVSVDGAYTLVIPGGLFRS